MIFTKTLTKHFCAVLTAILISCIIVGIQPAYAADVEVVPVTTEDNIEYYELEPDKNYVVYGGQEPPTPLEEASQTAWNFLVLIMPFLFILIFVIVVIVSAIFLHEVWHENHKKNRRDE